MKKARFGIIAVLLVALAAGASATPAFLYGVNYNTNQLDTINPTTGVFSVLGTITGSDSPSNFLGIANGPGGNLYGIDTTNGNLYRLSPTGAILANMNINSGGTVSNFSEGDMTFNGSTGYVDNTAGGGSPGLFSFTTSAGSISGPIGGVTTPTFDGLAFVGSVLYGLSSGDGTMTGGGTQLYTVNTTTGAATALPNPTGINLGAGYNFGGLAYSGTTLYAEVSGSTKFPKTIDAAFLYTINPITGVATLVAQIEDSMGNPYSGGLSGIAFEPATTAPAPEPGTMGLMLAGLAGLAFSRRRLLKR